MFPEKSADKRDDPGMQERVIAVQCLNEVFQGNGILLQPQEGCGGMPELMRSQAFFKALGDKTAQTAVKSCYPVKGMVGKYDRVFRHMSFEIPLKVRIEPAAAPQC